MLICFLSLMPINILAESKMFDYSIAPYSWFFYFNDPDFNNPSLWRLVTWAYGSGNIAEWVDAGEEKYVHLRANEVTGCEWTHSQADQGMLPRDWGWMVNRFKLKIRLSNRGRIHICLPKQIRWNPRNHLVYARK